MSEQEGRESQSKLKKIISRTNKKAFKKSFWGSLSRVIGIGLGAGAGGLLHQLVGDNLTSWVFAMIMAIASFAFMWFAEYEREID